MRQSGETFMRSLSVAGAWPSPQYGGVYLRGAQVDGGIAITFNALSRSSENTSLPARPASGHTPTLVSSFHHNLVKVELNLYQHRLVKVELNAKLVSHQLVKVLVGVKLTTR